MTNLITDSPEEIPDEVAEQVTEEVVAEVPEVENNPPAPDPLETLRAEMRDSFAEIRAMVQPPKQKEPENKPNDEKEEDRPDPDPIPAKRKGFRLSKRGK